MLGFHTGSNTDYLRALGQVIHLPLSLSLLASQITPTITVLLFLGFSVEKWDLEPRRTWYRA